MKKIFAILMTVAMLLSLGAVVASAASLPDNLLPTTAVGGYSSDPSEFSAVGDVAITWDPEASSKLDLSDGDMADWAEAGYPMITVDPSNMCYWVKDDVGVPEGWQISTYFVADSEWFYIGFFVTDPAFAYGSSASGYNGDAFQVCIDFGGRLGDALAADPYSIPNPKNIFYSFSCLEDGAPIQIMRQESDNDMLISEANGDGVKGAARKTEDGWSAEFALSWEQLYGDYAYKAWDDPKIYIGGDENRPLKIGACLYYIDRSETGGAQHWAAGTTNGLTDDNGNPYISWTAFDNSINLSLEYQDGMTFACENIVAVDKTVTIPVETTAEETEAPTEPATEAKTEAKTEEPTEAATTAADNTVTTAGTTTEPTEGCASVIGFGAMAVLAAAAAAVVLKKKD